MSLLHIAIMPVAYLIATILRRFKYARRKVVFSRGAIVISLLTTLILFGVFFVPFAYIFNFDIPGEVATIVLGVSMMVAIFLIFYLYDIISAAYEDKLKSELNAQEKEFYFAQCQLMQESVKQMKSIRHDMKLHLMTARNYTANDKSVEATDYLSSLLGAIGKSEIYSDTGNIAFDSIINFKLRNAVEDNIKPEINVSIPPALNIEVSDIVTILGNLLDNALDAMANVEDKKIKLNIESTKGNLFIKIENTFDGMVRYSEGKEGDKQYILTRKNGGEHGYGLKNIRKSVEKYDGHIDISFTGNVFAVGILLYADGLQAANPPK